MSARARRGPLVAARSTQLSDALAPATPLARVQAAWEQAAGAAIAAAARPTAERDGVLTVSLRGVRVGAGARADVGGDARAPERAARRSRATRAALPHRVSRAAAEAGSRGRPGAQLLRAMQTVVL